MPISLPRVNPGDTITAADWNALVDAITSAFVHIDALEANQQNTGLAITSLIPPTGPYRIGDTLQVIGRNFQTVIGAVRVFLNTTPVLNLLPTSTDTHLDFVIPPLPNIPPNGTLVDLMVTNQTEQVVLPIQIQPQQVPLQGMITVDWIGIEPATPAPDTEAIIRYKVRAATNKQATWSITPQIDVVNPTAWASQIHVLRSDRSELTNKQITLAPGQELDLLLQIAKVPAGTNAVSFGASLTLAAETISNGSGVKTFTVGTVTPEPDNTITFVLVPAFSGTGVLVGNTLKVPVGTTGAKFQMTATFSLAGTYNVIRTVTAATGWTITPTLGTTDSYTITQDQVGTQNNLRYIVTCTAAATTPSQIKVELQRAGETKKKSLTLTLERQSP